MENHRGRFIVIEGLDGSGKSTHVKLLEKRLQDEGHQVYATAEPTFSCVGGIVRDALGNIFPRSPEEMAALFLSDRINHNINSINGIERYLREGTDVICDRYYYSSMTYQGMDSDLDWVMHMNLDCPAIRRPDLCIFLDVDPERCDEHIHRGRLHYDIFEYDVEIIRRTRDQFNRVFTLLGEKENIIRIDASRPKEAVAEDVYSTVAKLTIK